MVYASQPRRAAKYALPLPRVTICIRRPDESGYREGNWPLAFSEQSPVQFYILHFFVPGIRGR
jgi:hypothetical protein